MEKPVAPGSTKSTSDGAPGASFSVSKESDKRSAPLITLCKDPEELALKAANRVVEIARNAIDSSGRFIVALSGGSTPRKLYDLLATDKFSEQIDWSATHLFWSDERCVPPEDAESNFKMVNETLLNPDKAKPVKIPKESIHRIQAELNEAGAEAYDEEIRDLFRTEQNRTPGFDLLLLGMGADGHIASIFPESHTFNNENMLAQLIYAEHLDSWRVTLTPRVIRAAKHRLLLISGKEKADMLNRVFSDLVEARELPARMLLQKEAVDNTELLVDTAAYSKLSCDL